MFSRTVEYALRAIVQLAKLPDSFQSIAQVSKATQVPAPYLSKVLQNLERDGLVVVKRGVTGGYSLSKAPSKLSLFEVVQAVDPIQRIRTCPLELTSHGKRLCSLHKKLDDSLANMEAVFRSTSLADIINSPNTSIPLCDSTKE